MTWTILTAICGAVLVLSGVGVLAGGLSLGAGIVADHVAAGDGDE